MRPVIYALKSNDRALHIAKAMRAGFSRHGVNVPIRNNFNAGVEGDVAIAYGWNHQSIFNAYPHYLYFDLGYWGRTPRHNIKEGYHRLSVDSWCTADNMTRDHDTRRLNTAGVIAQGVTWGNKIILAGMSDKAAITHGFRPGQWESEMMDRLKDLTTREIVFRPKPKSGQAGVPIEEDLKDCWCIVSNHSNVSVDALIAGVPSYARRGVGRLCSIPLEAINDPPRLTYSERVQLLSDISYAQWLPAEMRTGECWAYARGILERK